jgi:hypothetical protein
MSKVIERLKKILEEIQNVKKSKQKTWKTLSRKHERGKARKGSG